MRTKENPDSNEKRQRDEKVRIVRQGLRKAFQSLDEKMLDQGTCETILAPQGRTMMIDGKPVPVSEVRMKIAQTIEETGSTQDLDKAQDFSLMVAQSIENINCETSSSQEYFRWLDETGNIIKHMNDGYVSEADLKERNDFLDMSHQRETELLVCLGLYAGSNSPKAAEQARVIHYKLVKLREMRSAIQACTKDKADVRVTEEEYHRAIPYYKLCKHLEKLPFGYDISTFQKQALGIDHDDDADLTDDQALKDRLTNEMLDKLCRDDPDDFANIIGPETLYRDNDENDFLFGYADQLPQSEASFDTEDENQALSQQRAERIAEKVQELTRRKKQFILDYNKAAYNRA